MEPTNFISWVHVARWTTAHQLEMYINIDLNTTSPENLKLKTEKGHFKILYIICPI